MSNITAISRPMCDPLLQQFVDLAGSDLYVTVGVPASVRVGGKITTIGKTPLTDTDVNLIVDELLSETQRKEFYTALEFDCPLDWTDHIRFRINVFRQQQHTGLVIRRVGEVIPSLEQLGLPRSYAEMIMENRGLVLVCGPTGSGKSSSIAAMVGHRNLYGFGHIVTIEDPIEFVHQHHGCIITQRDVGVDTVSYEAALKHALRQRPDVVVIGEIRDQETMEHSVRFSETGHLCVSTLHAGNVMQALERITNFIPAENHQQFLYGLSQNLKAIFCQRLVVNKDGKRTVAVEIMINRGLIRTLIQDGKFKDIYDLMAKNQNEGMQTLDQALYKLYRNNIISEEVALAESDNTANLRLQIRQSEPEKAGHAPIALRNTHTQF